MKTWFALLLKKWRVSHGQRSKPLTSLAKAYYPVHQVPFLDQLQKKQSFLQHPLSRFSQHPYPAFTLPHRAATSFFRGGHRIILALALPTRNSVRIPSTSPVLAGKSRTATTGAILLRCVPLLSPPHLAKSCRAVCVMCHFEAQVARYATTLEQSAGPWVICTRARRGRRT